MYRVTSQTATSTTAAPSGNLFSALSSAPEVSTGLCCTISSVQYGISSLPVCSIFSDQSFLPYCWARMHVSCSKCFFVCLVAKVGDRSAPSRGSLSVPRHLSQRRVRLPLRRYHTKTDAPKVENRSFFSSLRITSKSRKENVNWFLFFLLIKSFSFCRLHLIPKGRRLCMLQSLMHLWYQDRTRGKLQLLTLQL